MELWSTVIETYVPTVEDAMLAFREPRRGPVSTPELMEKYPIYYLAGAILSGALVVSVLALVKRTEDTLIPKIALGASALTFVVLVAYAVYIPSVASSFTSVGNYFDPTHPTKVMADPQGMLSGFLSGDQALLFWGGALVLGALIPGVAAFLTFKQKGSTATAITSVAALCALSGGLCFRAVLYALGFSVFVLY